ncbi:MAG: DUF3488 domain-containing protein, partial [Planctomycetota bacterium]
MKSLSLYRTSVFFVAFASSLAMAPAEGNLVPPFLFLGIALPLWWARNRSGLLPPKTTNQLFLVHGILLAIALVLIFLGPTLLASWFHISILLLAYTFYTARKAWSYGLVYALSLLQVLVASAPYAQGQQILILAYLLLMATFSLVLHHLMGGMRERVRAMPRPDPRHDPVEAELSELPRVNRLFLTSVGLGAAVLLVAVPLFLLLPRNPAPPEKDESKRSAREEPESALEEGLREAWPVPPAFPPTGPGGSGGLEHSGFSGSIDLGQWGVLFESGREVLRVVTYIASEPHLPDLGTFYLKGVVLDRFDGRRWTATRSPLTRIRDGSDGKRDKLIRFEPFDLMDKGVVLQHIMSRREFGPIRFQIPVPVGYGAPMVYLDPNDALWARPEGFAEEEVESYYVYSRPFRLSPRLLRRLKRSR